MHKQLEVRAIDNELFIIHQLLGFPFSSFFVAFQCLPDTYGWLVISDTVSLGEQGKERRTFPLSEKMCNNVLRLDAKSQLAITMAIAITI